MTKSAALPRASEPVQPSRKPPPQHPSADTLSDTDSIKARIGELDHEIKKLKDHRDESMQEGQTAFTKLKQLNADLGEAKAAAIISGNRTEEHKLSQEYDSLFERNRSRQNDLRSLATAIEIRQKEAAQLRSKYRQSYRGKATKRADEAIPSIENDIVDAVAEYMALLKAKYGLQPDPKVTLKLFSTPQFKSKLAEHTQRIDDQIGGPPL